MDEELRKGLWEELKLLQPIIDKFDNFTFKIKNWFITVFVAVSGYCITTTKPDLLFLNVFIIVTFYLYEVAYRTAHGSFLERCREIQSFLREEKSPGKEDRGPYLDRYLFPSVSTHTESRLSKVFYEIYLRLGIDKSRAEKNATSLRDFWSSVWTMPFQLRVSLIYWFALLFNAYLAYESCQSRTLLSTALIVGVLVLGTVIRMIVRSRSSK